MDGLEISEIAKSKVFDGTTIRFDSEYYKKHYLDIETIIQYNQHKYKSIESFGLEVNASAFYPSLEPFYDKGNIPFIRVADVKETIHYDTCVKVPKMGSNFDTLYLCKCGDIVLTKGGTVGLAGLITRDSYVTRDLIFINSSILSPKDYIPLFLFFKTDFMYKQMIKSSSLSVQPHLTITLIRELLVYDFCDSFKEKLLSLYNQSVQYIESSETHYKQAEVLLDGHLGVTDIIENSCAVKTLSQSFMQSGRLDSEYYQPKYESLIAQINTNETVSSLCNLFDSNFIPESDNEYRYIELSNVGASGDISNIERVIGSDLPSRARRVVKTGQVIVSSIEGSLSSCALIDSEYDNALCSTGFYVINSDKINSETLLVLFKSKPIQALLKQRCSGTILTAISKDEFLNMPLPYIDDNVQKEISDKVKESFRLRKEAKRLLDNAIKAVEMAIETDEESALLWLELQ